MAQSNWSLTGNAPSSGEFIGTTSDFPFIIKTHDTVRVVIDEFGKVSLKTMEGTGIRLLRVNEDGDLVAMEPGSNTEILNGEGEWIPLPSHLFTIDGGGNTILSSGKLKIGSGGAPTKELEVNGEALISSLSVNVLKITGLSGSGNRLVTVNSGNTAEALEFSGDERVLNGQGDWVELPDEKWERNGSGDISIESAKVGIGTATPVRDFQVVGEVLVEGNLEADSIYALKFKTQELDLGNDTTAYKFGFLPLSGGGISVWGGSVPPASDGGGQVDPFPSCTGWGGPNLFQQSGMFQAYGPNSFLMTPTNSLYRSLFMGVARKNPMSSETHGYIEMTDAKTSPTDGITPSVLHINTRCGRDVMICNENEGVVTVGKNIEAGDDVSRDLNIIANIGTSSNLVTALAVSNSNSSNGPVFSISGRGKTQISINEITNQTSAYTASLSVGGNAHHIAEFISEKTQQSPGYNTIINVDQDETIALSVKNRVITGDETSFKVYGNGKTLIGRLELNPNQTNHTDALLQVGGKIVAKELRIIRPMYWFDSVFDKDYQLHSLSQLQDYVSKYKHLPDIPSELEIMKNGYNLSEMDALLLKKIEELTLYILQQDKLIQEQNQKILNLVNELSPNVK